MKIKNVQLKKAISKPSWAEDDSSNSAANHEALAQKKKKNLEKAFKISKTNKRAKGKTTKKSEKRSGANSSDEEDYDASIDKLKKIDPEFYKVL